MDLTPSQEAAVTHRGSSLLLSASAGSGKTEVLARRCVSLITDHRRPCGVDRLLVVTFTRAAAAELRVRIARMLREAADKAADADLRAHLRRQEILVPAAEIGTIDSWCARLLREHAVEAGVDPTFATLSEQDALVLRKDVTDRLFEWIYTADDPHADAARAWVRRNDRPTDEFLRGMVDTLANFREHLVIPEAWFTRQGAYLAQSPEELTADARRTLASTLRAECQFQREQLSRLIRPELSDPAVSALGAYSAVLHDWHERLLNADALADIAAAIEAYKFPKALGVPDGDKACLDEVRKRWLEGRLQKRWGNKVITPIVETTAPAAELCATLLGLEQRYQENLARAKRQQNVLEFGDVLRGALNLLGRTTDAGELVPTQVASELRRRYEHVLVDEYQDTSPVQVTLLRLVTRDEPGTANRFMVGDVKQSIYGFREAEPRLFVEQAHTFDQGREEGCVLYLADNFRSHSNIVAGLNHLFARLFDVSLGGTPFGEQERLSAGRDEVANPGLAASPRIQVHVLEAEADRSSIEDVSAADDQVLLERIEREAVVAAGLVRDMFARDVQVPARLSDGTMGLRPLRRSDIAILLRSAQINAGYVARVFRDHGLPCMAGGRESLLAALEVQDVCNALRLLGNRRQGIPLAAYLRGPLVGMTGADLWSIRKLAPDVPFAAAVACYRENGLDRNLVACLDDAMEQLERWNVASRHLELPALLRRVIRDGELELFAAGLPDGPRRVATLDALLRYATAFAASGENGVGDFVQHLDQMAEQDLDPGAALAGESDVVNIMTVHGAKGLEFPVVLLLNAGASFNISTLSRPLQLDEQRGIGLRFKDFPQLCELQSAAFHCMRHEAYARDIEEELRLLYVATTRAREQLFVIGHTPPGAWERGQALYATDVPPLISRLTVRNTLEWVLMAAAGRDVPERLLSVTTHDAADVTPTSERPMSGKSSGYTWTEADEAWLMHARRWLDADVNLELSRTPAVMSVSRWKELATRDADAELPRAVDAHTAQLAAPAFASDTSAADGRTRGTAVHCFLQHADLTRIDSDADIRAQVAAMVADGGLEESDAAMLPIDDLLWLGQSDDGRLLASHADRCRREVPLVYAYPTGVADERTVIRGVIDCLVETPNGLVLLDYKTDSPRDDADLRRRIAGYEIQLQLYAVAAAEIFERPVTRAALIFLGARVTHDCRLATPSLRALLEAVDQDAT